MACTITSGISIACADLKRAGGVNKRLWLFNIDDLSTPIIASQAGYVTNIPLTTYRTLYKIEGNKFSHSFEVNEQRTDSGNVQWEHKVLIKVFNTDPTEDAILEQLALGEFGCVVQTNNLDFLILGAQNGLTSTEAKLKSGVKSGDDSTSEITLTGIEQTVYKRLIRGGTLNTDPATIAATLAYLNAITV
jgi:hypothetical protein